MPSMTPTLLRTGRRVNLNAFHATSTYGGVLEGRPNAKLNHQLMADAVEATARMWGRRATLVVPPRIEMVDGQVPFPRLPSWTCMAWMMSDAMDDRYFGSELVVIWYQHDLDVGIAELLKAHLADVQWEAQATDWDP